MQIILRARFDLAGAAIITAAAGVIALYFATTFEVAVLTRLFGGTIAKITRALGGLARWPEPNNARALVERAKAKAAERAAKRTEKPAPAAKTRLESSIVEEVSIPSTAAKKRAAAAAAAEEEPPFDMPDREPEDLAEETEPEPEEEEDIPIRPVGGSIGRAKHASASTGTSGAVRCASTEDKPPADLRAAFH